MPPQEIRCTIYVSHPKRQLGESIFVPFPPTATSGVEEGLLVGRATQLLGRD